VGRGGGDGLRAVGRGIRPVVPRSGRLVHHAHRRAGLRSHPVGMASAKRDDHWSAQGPDVHGRPGPGGVHRVLPGESRAGTQSLLRAPAATMTVGFHDNSRRSVMRRYIFAVTLLSVLCILAATSLVILSQPASTEGALSQPPPAIVVTASYPGANAQVVADSVAAPIEQQVNGLEGVRHLVSRS